MPKPESISLKLCYLYGNPAFGEMVDLIGADAAIKLIKIFGGTRIRIPAPDEVNQIAYEYRIFQDVKKGIRIVDIAKKYGITTVNVQVIKKKFREIFERGARLDRTSQTLAGNQGKRD